jgi:circadian clock protein KaiB
MGKFKLRLYVTGKTAKSERAIANLKIICDSELKNRYILQVIDVLDNPQLAEDERIIATPTLIKDLPPPLKRIIGDLSNAEKVLLGLDLAPFNEQDEKEEGQNE